MKSVPVVHMSLPEALEKCFGTGVSIEERRPVSGGDINRAYSLFLSDGTRLFMKANRKENRDFFRAEAEGLEAMKMTGAVCVPEVLAAGWDAEGSFLLLEYIEEGRKSTASSAELGRRLAAMHTADTSGFVKDGKFGFLSDNYIGAGMQINTPAETWTEFFIQNRLAPQFERAAGCWDKGFRKKIDEFLTGAERILTEPEHPSLLHGDLWAGNYMIGRGGTPWLIDPAAYVGHPEADLAMTELFGGFDRAFYDAYKEAAGIDGGYRGRRDLYNLYHLLNHLNLFGGSYLYAVKEIVERYR